MAGEAGEPGGPLLGNPGVTLCPNSSPGAHPDRRAGGDTAGWQQGQCLGPALTKEPQGCQDAAGTAGQTDGLSINRTGSP